MRLFPIGIVGVVGRLTRISGPSRARRVGASPAQVVAPEEEASVVIAAILQRGAMINSAGGYLRNLTAKAKEGKFSAWPMVMALWRVSQGLTKRE